MLAEKTKLQRNTQAEEEEGGTGRTDENGERKCAREKYNGKPRCRRIMSVFLSSPKRDSDTSYNYILRGGGEQ